ncbi:unnamed protein product [Cochlearia groenlandica]
MIKKLVPITKQCAKHCLGDRYKFMKETTPSDICITHSVTRSFIIWKPKNTLPKESSSKETQKLLLKVVGPVRDQEEHNICVIYAACDLVSSVIYLHGYSKEYVLFIHNFLFRISIKANIRITLENNINVFFQIC